MLVIRLQRTGRENTPTYRLVVSEKARHATKGCLELIGHYLPTQKDSPMTFKADRVRHWVSVGAHPSDTVARLLKRNGVDGMEKFIRQYAKRKPKNEEAAQAAPAPAAAQAAEAAPAAA